MIYHWYQANFKPEKGKTYNRARFRAISQEEANAWSASKLNFKDRVVLSVEKVSPELELKLNQQLLEKICSPK